MYPRAETCALLGGRSVAGSSAAIVELGLNTKGNDAAFDLEIVTGTYLLSGRTAAVGDADGDGRLEVFFADWGIGSAKRSSTCWALEDADSRPPDTGA